MEFNENDVLIMGFKDGEYGRMNGLSNEPGLNRHDMI
jgi:hypothetical protein